MKKQLTLLSLAFLVFAVPTYSQDGMGIGNSNPLEMLDVTGAIKIGTDINNSTAAPSGGAGTVRFRNGVFEGWNGTAWVVLGSAGADADWTIAGNNIHNANSGNVGIGTTSPVNLLHIQNNVSGLNFPLFLRNASINLGDGAGIGFLSEPNGDWTKAGVYYERTAGFGVGKLHFLVDDGADNQSVTLAEARMTITPQGNVGIGGTSPDATLDVVGTVQLNIGTPVDGQVLTTDANGNAVWTDPATIPAAAPFTVTSNVVHSNPSLVDYATDDFLFGSPQLSDDGDLTHDGRMFYDKSKLAFRAGSAASTQWDDSSVGNQSVAIGRNTTASGTRSAAFGTGTEASGNNSTAMGSGTITRSFAEFAVGRFNTDYTPISSSGWYDDDRLFIIGNGTGSGNRSNALVVLKDGKTGIGTSNPSSRLDVEGKTTTNSFKLQNNAAVGRVLVSDGDGDATWTEPDDLAISDVNWTGDGTGQIYQVDLTDEIGIGTNNPYAMLEVVSNVEVNKATNASGIFRLSDGTGNLIMDANEILSRSGTTGDDTLNIQRQGGDLNVSDGGLYVKENNDVGLSTTAPNHKLHINQGNSTGVFTQFTNSTTGTASSDGLLIGLNNAEHALINQREANDIIMSTNDITRMRILSDGNVGVGTGTPRALLEIASDTDADLATNGSGVFRINGATNNQNLLMDVNDIMARTGNTNSTTLNLQRQGGALDVSDGGLYVKENNDVGLSTTAPNHKLHINQGNSTGVFTQFTNSTTGTASSDGLLIGLNNAEHALINQREANDIIMSTNDITRMRILSDGNVGVGTGTPRALLEIASDTDADLATNGSGVFRINGATNNQNLLMDVNDIMARTGNTNSTTLNLQRQGGDLSVGDGKMVVKNGGNVGIETTSPSRKLHVNNNGNGQVYAQVTNATTGTASGDGLLIGLNSSEHARIMQQEATDMVIGTSGTQRMRILADGKVGVGSNTPTSLFEVNGPGVDKTYDGNTGNYVAVFRNTNSTAADGIAIQIEKNNADAENNFVTFVDGSNRIAGRIEGFQDYDWETPPNLPYLNVSSTESVVATYIQTNMLEPLELPDIMTPDIVVGAQSLPSFNIANFDVDLPSIELGTLDLSDALLGTYDLGSIDPPSVTINLPNVNLPNLPSFTIPGFNIPGGGVQIPGAYVPSWYNDLINSELPLSSSEIQELMCWGVENDALDMVTMDPTELAMMGMKIAARQICNDGGVTYASKGADYAEWIPKENPNEHFNIGEIVGVKNGHITKNTEDAEQIMIVSSRPIVLGNTPPADEADKYVKVGFMGQVMTMVRGKVNVGDYIVPSGHNDGTAIAVSPEDLTIEQIPLVAGKAWEGTSDYSVIGFVNVAVGLKTTEWVDMLRSQAENYEDLKAQVNSMNTELEEIKTAIGFKVEASRVGKKKARK